MMKTLLRRLRWVPLGLLAYYIAARIVRQFYKFPMPAFLANFIDNPLRRHAQPPDDIPRRMGVKPGMTVLEVGPGNGRYTVAFARAVGPEGRVVALDIEPKMVQRTAARAAAEVITNLEAVVGDVYALQFPDATFDAVVMITVAGELPDLPRAFAEFQRVLKPGGTIAFGEILVDPDFPLPTRLANRALEAGFTLKRYQAGMWQYTLVMEKGADPTAPRQGLAWFDALPRPILRLFRRPPQIAYRLGLGPQLGRMVLLLTTTGRKSGLPRVTPLQYEAIEGTYYVASMRGRHADWVRNIEANPCVNVQVRDQQITGEASVITAPAAIADFISYRLAQHPRMLGMIMRMDGLSTQPTRAELETYASGRALIAIRPVATSQKA